MEKIRLYRKRIIPNECVLLKDDEILYLGRDRIVTRWRALRPRKDLHHGYSCYFLDEGFKVSKFYGPDNSLLYWYCDIIESESRAGTDGVSEYLFTDLLADVIVYPDGFVKVVDLDELVTALNEGKISVETLKKAVTSLDSLLKVIYSGQFCKLMRPIEDLER